MPASDTALPQLPPHFAKVTRLGDGGQTQTLAALDLRTERPVVVKVLELSRARDWAAVERFERECAVLQSLDHPGVPAYLGHAVDEDRGQVRLVMERIEGRTLAEDLARGRRRTEAQLFDVLGQLLDVLEYLHGLHPPVIHRDIKPGNVVVRPDDRVALVDFGAVAKVFQPRGATTVVGTFGYMAPEQLHGSVTPACDLYALGATVAALATGEDADRLPRRGLEVELADVIAAGPLRAVLAALLRADPQERPDSVAAVRALIARGERSEPTEPSALPVHPERASVAPVEPAADASGGLAGLWRALSARQRTVAIGYLWVLIGLVVVTRAIPLLLVGALLLPVVVALIGGLGRRDD